MSRFGSLKMADVHEGLSETRADTAAWTPPPTMSPRAVAAWLTAIAFSVAGLVMLSLLTGR